MNKASAANCPLCIVHCPFTSMPRRRAQYAQPLETPTEQSNTIRIYPLVPARDTVVFPRLISPITAGRERSVRAIEDAMLRDQSVVEGNAGTEGGQHGQGGTLSTKVKPL